MKREITAIWLDITTACDRKCPECTSGIPWREPHHHDWPYFERLANYVYGIDRIHLTGGEPTIHPRFGEFVPEFKKLFGCKILSMWTDGFHAQKWERALHCFDFFHGTRYGDYNADKIAWLAERFPNTFTWCDENHVPLVQIGGGWPCERGVTDPGVAYADGRFYPCCIGPGFQEPAPSLEPCLSWRERIQEIEMPCDRCCLSISKAEFDRRGYGKL